MRRPSLAAAAISIAFLLSGAAALIYEVAWTRLLVVSIGNTPLVHALTVSAFMLGLGLGALLPQLESKRFHPLIAYMSIEAIVGLSAGCAWPMMLAVVGWGYRGLADADSPGLVPELARGLAVLVAMGAPALLMGAAYPRALRAWRSVTAAEGESRGASGAGWVYGVNTAGAVAGALLAGFVLVPAAGAKAATVIAMAANVAAAMIALALCWRRDIAAEQPTAAPPPLLPQARSVLWLYALAGFCTLALQLMWTRLLALHLRGVTYTFTVVLAVSIAGLALGDLIGTWWLTRRWRVDDPTRARARLGRVQLVAAALVTLSLWAVPQIWELRQLVETMVPITGTSAFAANLVLVTAAAILPFTVMLGLLFPLAAAAVVVEGEGAAPSAARLYCAGSIGGAAGAMVGGTVLAGLVGLLPGIWLVSALLGLGGIAALWGAGRRELLLAGPALAVMTACFAASDLLHSPLVDTGVFHSEHAWGRRVADGGTREGLAAIVTVVDDRRTGDRILYTDEFAATSTASTAAYMRLLGHLPVMGAAGAEPRALVLCYGTGTTASSVAAWQRVASLDIVEISAEVLELSGFFESYNRDVLADPRVRTFVRDGRDFLATARRQWDVISLEPLLPSTPQAVHFYTQEFYAQAALRLAPGGVLCQWLPVHSCRAEELRAMIATFWRVFPDTATVWFFEESLALLGGASIEHWAAAMQGSEWEAAVAADLAGAGISDSEQLAGACILGPRELESYCEGAELITDDRPWTEFYSHGGARERLAYLADTLEALATAAEDGEPPLGISEPRWRSVLLGMRARAVQRRAEIAMRAGGTDAEAAGLLAGQAVRLFESALIEAGTPIDRVLTERGQAARKLQRVIAGQQAMGDGDVVTAIAAFSAAWELDQNDADLGIILASCLRLDARAIAAQKLLDQLTARFPEHSDTYFERARLRRDLGDRQGMQADLDKAVSLHQTQRDLQRTAEKIAGGN